MGIIIHDELTLDNGLVVRDTYASLAEQPINVLRTTPYMESNTIAWVATITYNIWANQTAANKKAPALQSGFINTKIDTQHTIFDNLYSAMKAKYQSTTDC
jgi:hypothetical protein